MLKFLKDKKKDNKGFTLVELVIVVESWLSSLASLHHSIPNM